MQRMMAEGPIDTHHHILPPRFVEAWSQNVAISHGRKLPPWSREQSLAFMDRHGIQASILSLGAQATSIGSSPSDAAAFVREINADMAALRDADPARFGFFACLPSLDDRDACLREIRHALGVLRADGVNLLTSYGSKYLGHPDFAPVWAELDRQGAVVFVHPGLDGVDAIREPHAVPSPVVDWTHETTRAATHLITTGVKAAHPRCKIILSHGGGTLPYVAPRAAHLTAMLELADLTPEQFLDQAKSFYFDVALVGFADQLRLLLDFAQPGHVLYGTDHPFARDPVVDPQLQTIDDELARRSDAAQIRRGTALRLFPRLAALLA